MGDLFRLWGNRVDDYARRAVDAYQQELAEYRNIAGNPNARAEMLDFALFLRRRTVTLAADNQPFSDHDLDLMAEMGRQRGELGVSMAAQRHVLLLHTRLTLREVYEAAEDSGCIDLTMRTLGWLAPAGLAAQGAYTRGYLTGQKRFLPAVTRVRMLVEMLLADDIAAPELARSLGMRLSGKVLVAVIRVAGDSRPGRRPPDDELVDTLLKRHWVPITWREPDRVVALVPGDDDREPGERALALGRDVAELFGRRCAVGTAAASGRPLAEALTVAEQVAEAAPPQIVPSQAYTVADVFVELGAARMPQVDEWLHDLAGRLAAGPDLVTTLDAFYRADMNRSRSAALLHIHPRTLDYRLQRVRDLVGMDPGSTRGVRVLSTAVARILAGSGGLAARR